MTEGTVNPLQIRAVYRWLTRHLTGRVSTYCWLCGASGCTGRELCHGCLLDLPWLLMACTRCAQPLPAAEASLCPRCLRRPPPFQRVFAPFLYATPVDLLIQGFKFRADLPAGRLLAELLADHLQDEQELPELLLPVPLHPRRLRERGFNQAWEITRVLGRRLGLAVDATLLSRLRHTEAQRELIGKQRRRNVRGAFGLARPLPARHVAIVDDVLTTGHTAMELARMLRRAGADRVDVWVVARTP